MRVSDFTELPKLYPIHHIKCTKYGLDPPKFAYIEGITPDSDEPSDEGDDDIEYEIYVSQPWDDDTEIPAESNPEAEFENNTPLQEPTENLESIVEDLEQEPDELTFTDQLRVRVLPKIRTTRSGPATTEPTYKDVAKLIGYKQDKYENEYVKVICKGESTKMAFWASATQLVPKDENCNIKDILGSLKEKHNSRKFNKEDILYHTTSDTE